MQRSQALTDRLCAEPDTMTEESLLSEDTSSLKKTNVKCVVIDSCWMHCSCELLLKM